MKKIESTKPLEKSNFIRGALSDLHYPTMYPVFEIEEDEKEKVTVLRSKRIEKIKDWFSDVGSFLSKLLFIIFFLIVLLTLALGFACVFAFVFGIFHPDMKYPFFNLIAFQVTGSFSTIVAIFGFISFLVEELKDI